MPKVVFTLELQTYITEEKAVEVEALSEEELNRQLEELKQHITDAYGLVDGALTSVSFRIEREGA